MRQDKLNIIFATRSQTCALFSVNTRQPTPLSCPASWATSGPDPFRTRICRAPGKARHPDHARSDIGQGSTAAIRETGRRPVSFFELMPGSLVAEAKGKMMNTLPAQIWGTDSRYAGKRGWRTAYRKTAHSGDHGVVHRPATGQYHNRHSGELRLLEAQIRILHQRDED